MSRNNVDKYESLTALAWYFLANYISKLTVITLLQKGDLYISDIWYASNPLYWISVDAFT